MRHGSSFTFAGVCVACLASATAFAQAPPSPTDAPAASAPPSTPDATPDKQSEARTRFKRALELYDDGDFDAALQELERAYALAPSFRLLYNIGLIFQQLKDYARALDAFERYLGEGGAEVPTESLDEVHRRIDRLKDRVAYLSVETGQAGVEISVDDVVVGRTPLPTPVRVNAGQRRISARLAGYPLDSRVIGLAGGERASVTFSFAVAVLPPAAPPPRSHLVPYIAWGATGAVTIAAVATGVLALNATGNYDTEVAKFGIAPSDQSAAWEKAHGLAVTTDVLLGAAVLAAGVSVYLTLRHQEEPQRAALIVGPGVLAGEF
jgi:hypothetical protein